MQQEYSAEIIVVDDGSRDATRDVVVRETQSLPNNVQLQLISCHPNRGKGAAVKDGCLAACGRYVLFTDADLATPITEWDKLRAPLDAGCDLAIGSRVHPGGSDMRTTQPRYRRLLGRGYHLLVVLLAVRGIPDTQCGFKAMTRETAQELFPLQRLTGIVFDTELLYLAQRRGMDIAQVPVEWYNVGGSRMRVTIRQALRVLFDLLSIRLLHWRDPADKKSSQAEEVTQR
jgi:dolichyl-phosphate beta-glucosyltransferase